MLNLLIYCATHDDSPVIPAGDELHWIPQSRTNQDTGKASIEFELDAADLYCTGGTGEHQFICSVFADLKENRVGDHQDGRGIDVIA
jgi:hypothetical protein